MYNITITKKVEKEITDYTEYKKVKDEKGPEPAIYAYVHKPPYTRCEEITIFNQRIDELDLSSVIIAINNIK